MGHGRLLIGLNKQYISCGGGGGAVVLAAINKHRCSGTRLNRCPEQLGKYL